MRPAQRPAPQWIASSAAGVVVVLIQLWLLYPLHQTMDLPAWDELNFYALPGIRLAGGSGRLQSIEYGPLYSLLYAPLIAWLGLIDSIFVMRYLLTLAVTLLLFVLLLTSLRSWRAATALALVWAVAQANLIISTMAFHLALVLLLAALIVSRINGLAALLFLLLAGFVRPEYFLLALCYGGYQLLRRLPLPLGPRPEAAVLSGHRRAEGGALAETPPSMPSQAARRRRSARAWPAIGLIALQAALVVFLLARVASLNFSAGRSWLAFQQHYAFAQVVAGRYNLDPWGDFPYIIARDLPGAGSVGDVLRRYPGTLLSHVLSNLAALPGSLLQLVLPIWLLRVPLLLGALALGAALVTAAWVFADRARFRAELRGLLRSAGDVPALALLAPLTLLPNLLVSLRFPQYLMVLMPFLFWALGALGTAAVRGARSSASPRARALAGPGARGVTPLVVAALAVVLAVYPRPFAAGGPQQPRLLYAKIDALRPLMPPAPYAAYGGAIPAYLAYLCPGCRAVYPLNQNNRIDLAADVERHQPGVVAIDSGLLTSPFFDPAALAIFDSPQWRRYTVADEVVYLRIDPATAPAPVESPHEMAVLLPRNWQAWYHDRSLTDEQSRQILRLPGHFWIFTAQERRVLMRFTAYGEARGAPTAEPQDALTVLVNNEPAAKVTLDPGQVTTVELALAPGYSQIWLGAHGASPELRYVPAELAAVPEGGAHAAIRLLTIEPLP